MNSFHQLRSSILMGLSYPGRLFNKITLLVSPSRQQEFSMDPTESPSGCRAIAQSQYLRGFGTFGHIVTTGRDSIKAMQHITALVERHGLLIVFLNVVLARGGLPLPVIPTLMTSAALAHQSFSQIIDIVLVGVSGL